jgi:hypothetical protein
MCRGAWAHAARLALDIALPERAAIFATKHDEVLHRHRQPILCAARRALTHLIGQRTCSTGMGRAPMTNDDRHNNIAGVLLILGLGLLCWLWCVLLIATSGEQAAALGAIIGGMIGAGGAVYAVYMTLTRQRREDIAKVCSAVRIEVTTYCKHVIGALNICEQIATKGLTVPMQDAVYVAKSLVEPIIYPAVADRIGLLPHPQATIEFYMRIGEAKAMLLAMQMKTNSPSAVNVSAIPLIAPANAEAVADCFISALQLAKHIVAADDPSRTELDLWVQKITLGKIDAALESAKVIFPNATSFQDDQPAA